MRPLEGLLAALLTLAAITLFILPKRRYRWVHLLLSFAVLLSGVQILLEGYRWQIACDHVLAFLERHLRGCDLQLLDGTDGQYPEVEILARIPDRRD